MTIYDERPWIKSYDQGIPPDFEIPQVTYTDLLEEAFIAKPQLPAMHFLGKTLSFSDLDTESMRFAAFLKSAGMGPGGVVGIDLPNTPQYLISLAGTLRAGCAATGISTLLSPKEMAYQINDAGVEVLVILDAFFEQKVQEIRDKVPGLRHIVVTNVIDYLPMHKRFLGKLLKKVPTGRIDPIQGKEIISFRNLSDYPAKKPQVTINRGDTCLIQYTGGTTGMPKGTVLTHGNIADHLSQINIWFELGEEIFCSGFPFFHQAGLILCLAAMQTVNTQCLIPDPRNTLHICKEIAEHHPTILVNVPSLYQMLVEEPAFKKLDLSSVRFCLSGAAPFAVESIKALERFTGSGTVVEVYGMTETSPIMTMNPVKGEKRIGTVGLPITNTRIKLVDVETGTKEVPLGEEGELIIRGPQVMKGYHNKPDETDHAIRDFDGEKWLFTGDVARMDPDGYFSIADRVKDMLIVGGFKVFSREVEESLYKHPDIEFCAIIGLPNPDRPGSELVKAVVQLKEGSKGKDLEIVKQDIINYSKQNMSPYKVPKIVEMVEEIPLTTVGKVDKKALR
mmetsp:Transcript_3058/g.1758  ORF Transcript_3058/g.1758 Transcript_3058/m.1758 type:complete len:563 (+) Transcript_3058:52-1740(+)